MAALGKKAQVVHVWLTAFLTLIAGSPHVQCRCPDGRLKPFCLSFLFEAAAARGCCCAAEASASGSCCLAPSAPPVPEAVPSCCARCAGAQEQQTEEGADGATCVDAAGCSRTLVKAGDFAPTPAEANPAPAPNGPDLPPPGPRGVPLPRERGLLFWQAHLLAPPPIDLITFLHRLII